MKIALLCGCSLLWLAGCTTNPANDPTQVRLNDMDTRLGNVERVVSNQSLVDLSRRLDALEAQQRELRGNLEVLQNSNETARKSQRDLYADLDKRIAALEAGARGTAGTAGTAVPTVATGAAVAGAGATAAAAATDDQAAYNAAFDKLKAGNYSEAINAFQSFMKQYPSSGLLDNAQYWVGEAYYVTRDYEHAARAFGAVGDRWPTSRKAPDALLKLGYTQIEQNHLTAARATLASVVERYPGSDAAKLAQDRLKKLPAEGH